MTSDLPDGEQEFPVELPVTGPPEDRQTLRFLLMGGEILPPDMFEDGDRTRPLGWEQAAGAFQFYNSALSAAGRNFPSPECWWQIVDLKTMTIVWKHDSPIETLH